MTEQPETLLKSLCDRRNLGAPDFVELFGRTADEVVGKGANNPTCSERTVFRWKAGKARPDSLSADTRRVLKAMFGCDVAALFSPPHADDPQAPASNLEYEINMAAHDAQDDAGATAAASVSDTSLDQLTDDVTSLARAYVSLPPMEAFRRGRALQEQLQGQRDRTQIPTQQQRLLELTGQTMALLASAAFDLGSFDNARRLARATDLYGESARFEPLRAFADGILAYIAYFTGMPGEAVRKARRAQTYGGLGDVARRRLLAIEARAHGYLGDTDASRQAQLRSLEIEGGARDDLHDGVGGEFGFPPARLAMSSSSTALLIHDADQAEQSARRAIHLIRQTPQSSRSAHVLGGAAADLAMARLLANDVEGAAEALTPLWNIPGDQRVTGVLVRTGQIQQFLAQPAYRASTLPRELRDRVEDFTRSASTHQLSTRSALLQLEA
ncbi:DNA-binding protein [Streptomyces kunmingensis]|uniref:DNA-binding protein n=1 Tax=Streptomyces kunmingensis TaxID=68225 RepID=A0ABU6CQP3_9ACTN|nr:DNA-binding protein [Streptomyces kunmingensis]MEB3966362.1 DNA-binding protein [Streptomyces kunmingensis]